MGLSINNRQDVTSSIKRSIKWIIVFLAIVIVVSIVGIIVLNAVYSLDANSFAKEIAIVLLQLIAVGVVGSVSSLLLAQYSAGQAALQAKKQQEEEELRLQRERARAVEAAREKEERLQAEKAIDLQRIDIKNKNDLKKDIVKRLGQIYHDVKGVRRMLRAKVLSVPYDDKNISTANVYLKPYAQYMETFNDLQLDLEGIKDEIRYGTIHMALFSSNEEIYKSLKLMEEYLSAVFNEYETCKSKFNEKAYAPYTEFTRLQDLLSSAGKDSQTAFRKHFINEYKGTIARMLGDLVNLEAA
ncbi:hypothetical protein D3H65_31290 [Paraflavitalea soli]|uniref:Uncharacterized protein n=1 Tax=Paraflavitalea soli TaxID=2315862 RepID=A0A3B7N8P9_9BACT|nr:hypothetical protein [Paraflavitalea soli]AXY78211.1 hypothetical protein D3H65_31290 [Paraflavitalea soli]